MIPSTAHHPAEPAEREDPVNGLLDSLETLVTTLVEMGLEPQLRARLGRLLARPDSRSESRPGRAGHQDVAVAPIGDIDRAIGLANAAAFCDRAGRAARSEVSRQAAAAHAAVLRAEIASLRARSDSAARSRPDCAGERESDAPNARSPA